MRRLSPSLLLIPFILLALGLLLTPAPASLAPAVRHITIDATQYQFTPGRVRVNRGDRVVITLTASDVVHGFYLDGYGLKTRVEPGIAQQIEFVADRPGVFRYRCSVSCGPLHPFMIGELVVGPNLAFWRAGGLTLTVLAGTLAYLWRSGNKHSVIMEALYE
jgi:heme/copper-type cytochrome/quinol oxidase subunit 2